MTPPVTQGRDAWQVPDVAALRPLRPRRARWADVLLHRRRLVAAAGLFPLVLWAARTSLPPSLPLTPGWWVVLSAVALLSALALATYVPLARTDDRPGERPGASPCAAAAVVFVVLAGPALGAATGSPLSGAPALLLAAMGLGQRLLGAPACGPAGR
ncbi:hypothetical protein GCM10023168_16870 [Fodinibacter luteus]|uniref:Integral membrane protein n=1 Tax=Fodinibacter luteus TaxID=552064 RepID=A0ABP8KCZ5_9MICO